MQSPVYNRVQKFVHPIVSLWKQNIPLFYYDIWCHIITTLYTTFG